MILDSSVITTFRDTHRYGVYVLLITLPCGNYLSNESLMYSVLLLAEGNQRTNKRYFSN